MVISSTGAAGLEALVKAQARRTCPEAWNRLLRWWGVFQEIDLSKTIFIGIDDVNYTEKYSIPLATKLKDARQACTHTHITEKNHIIHTYVLHYFYAYSDFEAFIVSELKTVGR